MKKTFLLIIALVYLGFNINAQEKNKKDIELIKKTILTAYQDGLQNEGDPEKIDKFFINIVEDFDLTWRFSKQNPRGT